MLLRTVLEIYELYLQHRPTQLVIIVKAEDQSAILKSPSAGFISEVEGTGAEASFKQLTAGQGNGAGTTDTTNGQVYKGERNIVRCVIT